MPAGGDDRPGSRPPDTLKTPSRGDARLDGSKAARRCVKPPAGDPFIPDCPPGRLAGCPSPLPLPGAGPASDRRAGGGAKPRREAAKRVRVLPICYLDRNNLVTDKS